MNAQQINHAIFKLTPHETAFQNGHQDYSSLPFKTRKINGEEVPFIAIKDNMTYKSGPLFCIKKHSRFMDFPAHCHDGIEINYMYSGSCHQQINGKDYTLLSGQTLFLNSNTIHKILPLSENDILLNININSEFLISNFLNHFSCDSVLTRFFIDTLTDSIRKDTFLFFSSESNDRLRSYIFNLISEWFCPSIVSQDIMENLLSLIICELVNVYKSHYTDQINPLDHAPILPMLRYIEENYQNCTLTGTADFFNLNPNYLSNLLKKYTGLSYRQLVQQQKLAASEQLLRSSDLSVSEISHMIGYDNVNFFYQKFKLRNNCSPNDYRQKYK